MIHWRKSPRGKRILNQIPLSFLRESKEFRRGLDLPRREESKEQENSTNPWSKLEIAARAFEEQRGGGS